LRSAITAKLSHLFVVCGFLRVVIEDCLEIMAMIKDIQDCENVVQGLVSVEMLRYAVVVVVLFRLGAHTYVFGESAKPLHFACMTNYT
jgi:hypothetical protein